MLSKLRFSRSRPSASPSGAYPGSRKVEVLPLNRSGDEDAWFPYSWARVPMRTDDDVHSEGLIALSPVSIVRVRNDKERKRANGLRPTGTRVHFVVMPHRSRIYRWWYRRKRTLGGSQS